MIIGLLILSILPSIIILLYFYKKDKYEQEPLGLLLKAFGVGALSAIIVILVFYVIEIFIPASFITGSRLVDALLDSFLLAAVPEELLKFLMLYLIIWKNKYFCEKFDGIIFSVFISLGFATVENVIYVIGGGFDIGVARALLAVPAHALFGVAMGYYFSYAKFLPEYEKKHLSLSIFIPIILHGIYDFLLFLNEKYLETHPAISGLILLIFLIFVVFLWVQGFQKIKKLSSDFYLIGISSQEILEHSNRNILPLQEENITYLKNWQDITVHLFEVEKNMILEKYPNAVIDIKEGLVYCCLNIESSYSWSIQLTYARNYRKNRNQIRLHINKPDLNDLVSISEGIPYVKKDSTNIAYIDIVPEEGVSGKRVIEKSVKWIRLFERWVNGEIKISEFVISSTLTD